MDFFPTDFTFWNVLYYLIGFLIFFYIGFKIYMYVNNLDYEIDCENNDRCFIIKDREESEEVEEVEEVEEDEENDEMYEYEE